MSHAPLSHRPFDGFSDDAIDRFLAGESTPEEQARFQEHFARHAEDIVWTELFVVGEQRFASDVETGNARARLEASLRGLRTTRKVGTGERGAVLRGAFMRRGGFKPQPLRLKPWNTGVFFRRTPSWRVAGGVIALSLLVLAIGIWSPRLRQGGTESWTTYATANGERARIELGDGTIVSLNVASRLEVPQHFGGKHRTVRLSGEADFQVVHTSGAPFTVDAAGMHATVLGTVFDVQAYRPSAIQVAVQSGRVMLNRAVLAANDVAHASIHGPVLVVHHQDLHATTAFMTGHLLLDDIPLREAIESLNRWYDVDVRLGDHALGDLPVSANLTSGSAGDLADILRLMLDVRVMRSGRVLTLYQR